MLIRDITACRHRRVLDRSLLCELLHPVLAEEAGGLGCSIAHAVIPAGEATLPHRLNTSTELYYILTGSGTLVINGEREQVRPGQVIHIPQKGVQHIENDGEGELTFLCIVSPPWQEHDEELV